jgi:hypothetical protein
MKSSPGIQQVWGDSDRKEVDYNEPVALMIFMQEFR